MKTISISIGVIPYANLHIQVSPDMTFGELRRELARKYPGFEQMQNEEVLFFAAQPALEGQTLHELRLTSGHALFCMVASSANALVLRLLNEPSPCARIESGPRSALVGRNDEVFTDPLDLDLEPHMRKLGLEVNRVSRRQAWLVFEREAWFLRPHEDATAPVFINNVEIPQGSVAELRQTDVIGFGIWQGQPAVQFVVSHGANERGRDTNGTGM